MQSESNNPRSPIEFDENFHLIICRTISDIKKCMMIRYQVYCLRRGWMNPEVFPDCLETDAFDEGAVHILLTDRDSGLPFGTARVIYSDRSDQNGNLPSLALSAEFRDLVRPYLPIGRTIEVSRMALAPPKADRGGQKSTPMAGSLPMLGLIKGVFQAIAHDNVSTACLTTAPAIKRMFDSMGLQFHDLGVRFNRFGARVPLFRNIPALLCALHQSRPDIWRYMTDNGAIWPLDPTAIERERESCGDLPLFGGTM